MGHQKLEHAIVIGGSIAGLLATKVVSEVFDQVTLIERDPFPHSPQPRRGVPQDASTHDGDGSSAQVPGQSFSSSNCQQSITQLSAKLLG